MGIRSGHKVSDINIKHNTHLNYSFVQRSRTIEMGAFQFAENDRFDREEEYYNDANVFVGAVRWGDVMLFFKL